MSVRGLDLAARMVDLLDDASGLRDARDAARLLVPLFAETTGAQQISLQVRIPDPDRFATLGVLGHQHFASTLVVPAHTPGIAPLLHGTDPVWTKTRKESQDTMRRMLEGNTERVPDLPLCPPHLLVAALRTPQKVMGTVMLGSGQDGFRLADVTQASLLARFAGAVLADTDVATVFDGSGRLTKFPLRPDDGLHPSSTDAAGTVASSSSAKPEYRLAKPLPARQMEVLVAIAGGATNPEIAAELGLSVHTVRTHRRHLMESFGAHTSTALVARARGAGVLPS